MSLNSFLTNKFTKNIPYGTMVQALIVRYQTLFIIYINLAFLLIMVIWTLSDQFLFSLPGKSLIMPMLPLILASLASLKSGKVDMAAGLLLLYLHTANFICSHVGDLVLGSSQLLLLLPGIGYFISSSRTIHILNVLFCVLQNTGHIITISSVFQVTFTEEQSFQIFIFKAISFPMLLQSSLLFFAQKSIESKLWQMVQSNCERAEEITKELVEALEAKDVFVSSLSHEIRNPLNSLTGSIDYLLKVIKDNAHLQVLENAKLSGEVLLNLVSNLLDAAKLKSEKMELSYMETNPVDIIKKVLTINSSAFSHKRIFAQAFIEKNVPKKLTLDSSRILQILMNLVSNAIKFTFEGGRIQIQMAWCSQDKAHEELLQAMDTKFLADSVNCEDELFMTPKHSMMIDRRDSITKGIPTVAAVTKDTVASLCSSPNNEPACCDEFSTVESQSHICNLRHLKDNKKVKGLGQVYSFHSLLSENYDVLTASNMGPKSLYSLDDLICGSSEEKAAETKGYLKMQVTDTGCGIAEENIPKLFSMFSQADANVSRQYGGTGLGLWISKQLCQKMGGDIAVYSKLDHGTTFTFYIEVNNNMSMTDSTSKTLTKRHRGKVRALVVDDYAYNRDLHKLILEREGVEVHLACDGNEAVAKYKANEDDYFDFIMMDIQMPGLDGLSAAQQIRAFEAEKNYKMVDIYFVSGNYYANEAGILVENIPRTQFLRKPVNLDIIKKIVGTYGTLLRDINNSGNKRKNSFSKGRSHARKLSPNVVNCANQLMAAASTVSSGEADRKKVNLEANRIRNNVSDGTIMTQKKAVLIVDDDNFNIFTIQLQLENQNLDILVAHNGQEALEIVTRKHDEIDVVLMDCEMPIMSGYQATAKIRELEKNEKNLRPLRIYGLSGHTDNAHRVKCINSGMNNVLTKPLDFQKVVDLIYDVST